MNQTQKLGILLALTLRSMPADDSGLFRAIRDGDPAPVKALLTKMNIEARDQRGATPLMHAAAFGNLETLRILLDAGADVNARNDSGATALLWAARNEDKARLLLDRGADPNVQSRQGRTPLMVASMRAGGVAVVALMLSKGADVRMRDTRGLSAVALAAREGDVEILRLLLIKGADPHAPSAASSTLIAAAASRNPKAVQVLLQNGADVHAATTGLPPGAARTINNMKNGPANNSKVTALHTAAAYGPVESVRLLLRAGANVNVRDSRGLTPLFFALATEYPSAAIVRTLLQGGADPNARDAMGESPLDWAEKFGYPDIIAELQKAGAKPALKYELPKPPPAQPAQPQVVLQRALKLLESTSATFFQGSGCVSCHHQNLIARSQSLARATGVAINEEVARDQVSQMRAQWIGLQEDFLQAMLPGGGANRLAENLLGLKAANHPPDSVTDAAVVAVAESQNANGGWRSDEVQNRPPISQSPFSATTRVIRVLQDYAIPARRQEFVARVIRAKAWLMQAKPVTTEDYAMRLSGLKYSGASEQAIKEAAKALLSRQRADGGWGGNSYIKSDAYTTGGALVALIESKVLPISDQRYRRGVAFLLSTQFPDGSWHVRSRSIKFQPYFESGFPFGHDQWISTAATAWAAQAIALSLQPATVVATEKKDRRQRSDEVAQTPLKFR